MKSVIVIAYWLAGITNNLKVRLAYTATVMAPRLMVQIKITFFFLAHKKDFNFLLLASQE
jgi:hypothetical protein